MADDWIDLRTLADPEDPDGTDEDYDFPDVFDDEAMDRRLASHPPERRRWIIESLQRQEREARARGRVDELVGPRRRELAPTRPATHSRMTLRLPRDLHDDLRALVKGSGFSINTFAVAALSRAVGEAVGREQASAVATRPRRSTSSTSS